MKTDKKTILITGGAGFIGSHAVRGFLATNRYQVINVDLLTYAGNLSSLEDVHSTDYIFEQRDVRDYAAISQLFEKYKPDGVLHLAAESHVDRSIDSPGDFITTNVLGTYNLLQNALEYYQKLPIGKKEMFRFHHVSTDEVYGSLPSEGLFTETTPYSPRSPYSASKASSDHLVRAWGETFGLPVLVTNCSNNYGPSQFPEKFIPVIILNCLQGKSIPVYGDGSNVRDWLYVEDHVSALLAVFERGEISETYNIGGNNEMTNLEVVHTICDVLDRKITLENGGKYKDLITFVKDRPGHDFRYAIDASKIKEELGWMPESSPQSRFEKTVQWYLDNQIWWQSILDGSYQLERQGTI